MKGEVGFIVLLLTQAAMASKDPEVVCSSKPVEAAVSEDVILQCHLDPPLDVTNMTVEWSYEDYNHTVHLYQDRKDNPAEQREHFEGRTSLFPEGLTKGNLSLKLSSLRLSDTGRYRCSFSTEKPQNSCYVNLTVVSEGKGSWREQSGDSGHRISGHLRNGVIAVIVIAHIIVIVIIVVVIVHRPNSETTSAEAESPGRCLKGCGEVCVIGCVGGCVKVCVELCVEGLVEGCVKGCVG